MGQSTKSPSSYMDYLPAAYRQGEEDGEANLLGSFLKIFEKILTGIDDHVQVDIKLPDGSVEKREVIGVEQIVDVTHDYFDPLFAPLTAEEEPDKADFVQYLASWVALTLNQNWPENRKRRTDFLSFWTSGPSVWSRKWADCPGAISRRCRSRSGWPRTPG